MSSDAPRTRAWTDLAALGLTALVVVLADQVSKSLVAGGMALGQRIDLLGDLVILWRVENSGSSFSLFQFPGNQLLFYAVTVIALGMVAWFHRAYAGRGLWLQILLGVFLGGALGNLIDRLRFGAVTDFISIGFGDNRFPTWNIADASLTVSLTTLLVYIVFFERRPAEAAE